MRCLFIGMHIIYSSYIPFRALENLDLDVCLVGRDRSPRVVRAVGRGGNHYVAWRGNKPWNR